MNSNFNTKVANRSVLLFITVMDIVMGAGYLLEGLKGRLSSGFITFFLVTMVVSLGVSWAVYLRNNESEAFRHVSIIGFGIIYASAVFMGTNDIIFTMAFPTGTLYILYFDLAFFIRSCSVAFLINLASVIRYFMRGAFPSGAEPSFSLTVFQLGSIGMTLIVLSFIIYITNRLSKERLDAVQEEQEKTTALLDDVLRVAAAVKKNSYDANTLITEWDESTGTVINALEHIATGNNQNADSIESQTVMTSKIQEMISHTKKSSDEMIQIAKESVGAIDSGKSSIMNLKEKAGQIEEANKSVINSMGTLITNANDVESITKDIFSISSQTNLLALNASIESARAGEAGKGFAVVAEEIRVLADQTRELTENIKTIVASLQNNADQAQNVVKEVIEATNEEKELIAIAEGNFTAIETKMNALNDNVEVINGQVNNILVSNNEIVESIESISEVSAEVTESTNNAVTIGRENYEKAEQAKALMQELLFQAEELNKYNVEE